MNYYISLAELAKLSKVTEDSSSSISTSSIEYFVEKLRMHDKRQSTRDNYCSIWKIFNEFYIKLDMKPETWESEKSQIFDHQKLHFCYQGSPEER